MKPGWVSLPMDRSLELYCQTDGLGRPLVLLHGLFGAGTNLSGLARQLRSRYQVLRVDLRNHGRSPHSDDMSYPLMAADILQLLEDRGIRQCAILGHSMGGKVAMELALAQPGRVAALCVVDIAPIQYSHLRHDPILEALRAVPLGALSSRADADLALKKNIVDAGLRQFLLTNLYRRDQRFGWRVNLNSLVAKRTELAAAPGAATPYRGPTLFIKGSESDYINAASEAPIRVLFPAARMHSVQGAGHWVHAEKPLAFNAAVERFLRRYYPPR